MYVYLRGGCDCCGVYLPCCSCCFPIPHIFSGSAGFDPLDGEFRELFSSSGCPKPRGGLVTGLGGLWMLLKINNKIKMHSCASINTTCTDKALVLNTC